MSFQNLIMLSASVPKHKAKEEKDKDKEPKSIFDIIGNGN